MLIWAVIVVVVGLLALVRLAPSDPERWHVPVTAEADADLPGGAVRVIEGDAAVLQSLHEIALDTPRTRVLAGDVASGRITYITRSRLFGFPDYTTAELVEGDVRLHARLRFGQSDMGVNAARLEAWLARLGQG